MFFMQPSRYPNEPYMQYTNKKKMHTYTGIQLSLFALLYAVKSFKPIAIAFPIVIVDETLSVGITFIRRVGWTIVKHGFINWIGGLIREDAC